MPTSPISWPEPTGHEPASPRQSVLRNQASRRGTVFAEHVVERRLNGTLSTISYGPCSLVVVGVHARKRRIACRSHSRTTTSPSMISATLANPLSRVEITCTTVRRASAFATSGSWRRVHKSTIRSLRTRSCGDADAQQHVDRVNQTSGCNVARTRHRCT